MRNPVLEQCLRSYAGSPMWVLEAINEITKAPADKSHISVLGEPMESVAFRYEWGI